MGIHGIYKEIGPGTRIALSKLAVEKFEETGRPLRIAIDTSIWLFQIQASKGGTNPALRTFYYRLLRLISLAIHPVFVFDGPNKPPFKRNKRTGPTVASIPEFLAKQLLKQFGYPIHLAPGEAEAECALLQREGIVDAVLSEDVDTLMFGSGVTLRNWSPEKSGKTPTHVNVYDAVETKNGPSGLDREGMILVALMSGGDYVPEGIPGCGPKTACEAAKAGFGADLCKIPRNDSRAIAQWKERLQHELKTNESKFFKRKHGALKIPDDFPRLDILGYYTHPAISNQAGLDKLRRSINWDRDLDFPGLREFTQDAFDWAKLEGAKHFIRSLAPSLVVRQLRIRAEQTNRLPTDNLQAIQEDESTLIKGLHGKRQHAVTDHCTELRVSFTPVELVKIDLSQEDPDDDVEPPSRSSQQDVGDEDMDEDMPLDMEDEGPRKRGPTKFDPEKPARIWVMETFVKVGVPLTVQDWEAGRQAKQKPRRAASVQDTGTAAPKAKTTTRRTRTTKDQPQVRIESFAKVTKPGVRASRALAKAQDKASDLPAPSSQTTATTEYETIDLLSSSPVKPRTLTPRPQLEPEESLSPVLEDLPPSVIKRRRRAPIQRSKTLPADTSDVLDRPSTPPLLRTIETLDLAESPVHPSPLQLPAKKARTRTLKEAAVTGASRDSSVPKQTTLDAWRASATPTKQRGTTPLFDVAPVPAPPQFRKPSEDVESLDLTFFSPKRPEATRRSRKEVSSEQDSVTSLTTRPPLTSISSNTSASSTSSVSALGKKKSIKDVFRPNPPRRTSPRLSKTTSERSSVDTLDLTSPRLAAAKPRSTSPQADVLDLTEHSSPVGECDPAPQPTAATPTSPPMRSSRSPSEEKSVSPPAAWKAQSKKKRAIILRKSVVGAWDYVDVDSPEKLAEQTPGPLLKGKDRRKWRESAVEVLDLT